MVATLTTQLGDLEVLRHGKQQSRQLWRRRGRHLTRASTGRRLAWLKWAQGVVRELGRLLDVRACFSFAPGHDCVPLRSLAPKQAPPGLRASVRLSMLIELSALLFSMPKVSEAARLRRTRRGVGTRDQVSRVSKLVTNTSDAPVLQCSGFTPILS